MASLAMQSDVLDSTACSWWSKERRVAARVTAVATALFAISTISVTAANATVTLYVPPTGPHPQVSKPVADLSGHGPGITYFATTAQQIGYPASLYPFTGTMPLDPSVAAGVQALDAAIRAIAPGESIQIIGASQGDIVLTLEQRLLLANPPANNDITFVRIADPTSLTGIAGRFAGLKLPGYTAVRMPDTPYDTVIITRQYDGIADWPADSLNLVADLNALMGGLLQHDLRKYESVDPATIPDRNITTTTNKYGATITTYLIENEGLLPLLVPLQKLGVDQRVLDALQGPLKSIVDAGYTTSTWSSLHQLIAKVGTKAFQAVVNTISKIAEDVGVVLRKVDALGAEIAAHISAKLSGKSLTKGGVKSVSDPGSALDAVADPTPSDPTPSDSTRPKAHDRSAHVRKSRAAKEAPAAGGPTDRGTGEVKGNARGKHRFGKRGEPAKVAVAKGSSSVTGTEHDDGKQDSRGTQARRQHAQRHSDGAGPQRHRKSEHHRSPDRHAHGKSRSGAGRS